MNEIPGSLRTDQQPPMAVPLGHFVVALAFLVAGAVGTTLVAVATVPGLSRVAHVHVVLLGWVVVTIMGAMTQFVPVWSGVSIHSRRLAAAQLWLVVAGLIGFVAALLAGELARLPLVAAPILLGLWLFVYNVGRTLVAARPLDFTERHFALALGCFAALAPLGYLLAVDFTSPVFDATPVSRGNVLLAHATLALFGGVLATILGALRQLVPMFAQSELGALGNRLLQVEQACFPLGLAAFVAGRGLGVEPLARLGAIALLLGVAAFVVVLARLLRNATADRSPMTDRYWVVVASLCVWLSLTAPAWWLDPTGYGGLFGHPDATVVLVVGVFGFVVVGSLYHIVPFIIWIERYSDRLGFERVPMIDDLYDDRLERADLALTLVGFVGLAAVALFDLPLAVWIASSAVAAAGFCVFVSNALLTIHRHDPDGVPGVLSGVIGPSGDVGTAESEPEDVRSVDGSDP